MKDANTTNQPQPPGLLPGCPHLSLMHSPRVRPEVRVSLAVASWGDKVCQEVSNMVSSIYIVTSFRDLLFHL